MGSGASAANMNVLPKVNVSQPPFPAVRLAVNTSLHSLHFSIVGPPSSSSVASSPRSHLNCCRAPSPPEAERSYRFHIAVDLGLGVAEEEEEGLRD